MAIATLTSKGQVTLPKSVRDKLHLFVGERIDFEVDEQTGTAVMIPLNKRAADASGILNRYAPRKAISAEEMDSRLVEALRKEYDEGT